MSDCCPTCGGHVGVPLPPCVGARSIYNVRFHGDGTFWAGPAGTYDAWRIKRARSILERWFGYRVIERDYVEDSKTPGFLGQIRGRTDRDAREVVIGRKANPTERDLAVAYEHELRHVREPDWVCGSVNPISTRSTLDTTPQPS